MKTFPTSVTGSQLQCVSVSGCIFYVLLCFSFCIFLHTCRQIIELSAQFALRATVCIILFFKHRDSVPGGVC